MERNGVEVSVILLIIGSSSQSINNDQTNRGGSAVGRFGSGQQQVQVGLSYNRVELRGPLQNMKEALRAARILFNTLRFLQRKKFQSSTFVPLFMFSSVLLGAHR